MILTGKYETTLVHLFLLCILTLRTNHDEAIGLDNVIKGHFKWSEKGYMEKSYILV